MWFDLTLEARDGSRHTMRYNPHTSEASYARKLVMV